MRLNIAAQLNLFAATLIIVLTLLLSWLFVRHETKHFEAELNERGNILISNISYNSGYSFLVGDTGALTRLLGGVVREKDIVYASIEEKGGKVIARVGEKRQDLIKEFVAPVLADESFAEEALLGGEKEGVIRLGVSLSGMYQEIAETKWLSFLATLAALSISTLGFYLGTKFLIASPLGTLLSSVEKIGSGDLSHRIEIDRRDEIGKAAAFFNKLTSNNEIGKLGKAVNEMTKNLEKMTEELKEATSDAGRKVSYLNNIPTPVYVVDTDSSVQFINHAGAGLLQRTVDECLGKKCYELFKTKHCKTEKCRAAMAMKTDQVLTADNTANFSDGELPIRYTCAPLKDDAGNTIGSIEYLVDITDEMKIIGLAEMISQGDYSVEVEKRSEEDRLGPALNRMTRRLREVTEENEKQDWLKTGQTQLNDQMRGQQDIAALSQNIITFLAKYLNAQVGAMYLAGDNSRLQLVGSYALNKGTRFSKAFKFGEGLVGEAVLGKKRILLTNVPEDYIAVSSGLGDAVPRNILLFPCLREGEVKGVIELGSLEEFSDMSLDLLDQVAETIAVAVDTAQSRQRMQQLVEKTQEQAEELRSQQGGELSQSNEEGL